MPDVPIPKSVMGEAQQAGFVFYTAAEKPGPLGDFHKKELEAKGWKQVRSKSASLSGSTLTGIVQEYTKAAR
jgi:hypothetical protein